MRIAPFALLMTLLAASACEKERDAVSSENDSGVSLAISIDSGQTRSILEDEGVDSGFYMMIYNSDSGEFLDCISFESRSGGELILRKGEVYDMYVLGNMWYVDADGGRRTLKDIGVTSVSDYAYRFDGGVDAGGTRRENFSEIVRYGIPYSGMVKRVKAEEGATVNVSCTYLFAKLSVTVDHSGLVNGSVAESVFRNSKLYVRGANSVVKPFASSSVKAESASDLLAVSDYSSTMENGGSLTFTYYVPENAQGSDASVTDPSQKTTAMKPLATYIEFETVVDGAAGTAGGYGGTVTYQFCPGANATTDFNVLRNTQYNVTLSFKAGSLFSPSWKVGVDDWSDTRTIRFSADNAGSSESLLKDDGTQILAVRKNRPAQCYVYFNRSGAAGSNERASYLDCLTTAQAATYNPSNVSRSGYSLVYDSSVLSQYGMSLSYDSSTGKITVSYNAASAGASNFLNVNTQTSGIPVTVTLYPGGKTVKALVKTYENMAVTVTSGDRYVGMKTNVKASGFVGSDVKVSANNGSVTPGVFRTSNSSASDGSEGTDNYLGSTPVAVPSGTGLDLYAYKNAASLTLNFSTEDSFNDGVHSTTLTVYKPTLSLDKTSYLIPIDGTEVDVEYSYRDRSNAVMQPSVFDSAVYSQLMDPQLSLSDPTSGTYAKATECCVINPENAHQVYVWNLPWTTKGTQPTTNTPLGYVNVRGRNATLFPTQSAHLEFRYPSLKTGFSNIKSNVFNTAADPVVEVTATIDAAGCLSNPLEIESGAGTPSQTVRGYTVVSGNDYGAVQTHKDDGWNYVCLYFDEPDAGGNRVLHWRWKPNVSNPYNFGDGIYAPWGERKVQVSYRNKHTTASIYTTSPTTFDVSYQEVRILSFCSYPLGQQVGRVDLSCKLSAYLASKWHSEGSTTTVWGTRLFNSINYSAQARQRNMNDWDSPQGGALIINSSSLDARYISWSLEHMDWDPESTPWDPHYQDAVWDEDNIDEQQRRRDGLPNQMGFNGTSVTLLDWLNYPGSSGAEQREMQSYIPVRATTDVYVYKY